MEKLSGATTEKFIEIFAGRLQGDPVDEGGWTVWTCNKSGQTMSKFIDRAKKAGFKSAFFRPGKVGVRTEHLGEGV